MGSDLYRMIRDGAPPDWTPAMRLVAMVIADDARDPSQGPPEDGGWPWSVIRVSGYERDGVWHDGITERSGMSRRAISRALTALARAGYEMREQAGTDREGRPMFAYSGRRALRFRVLPLKPRDGSPSTATLSSPSTAPPRASTPSTATRERLAKDGDPAREDAKSGLARLARYGDPITPVPPDTHHQVVNGPLEGPRPHARETADLDGRAEGAPAAPRPDDDDDSETKPGRPERWGRGYGWCAACDRWVSVRLAGGLLVPHGWDGECPGSRQPPAEPVPCAGCGRTGLMLTAVEGLCSACLKDRKRRRSAGTP
jgi:hypothetical protein